MAKLLRTLHIAAGKRHGQGKFEFFELMLTLPFSFAGAMARGWG